MLFSSTAQEIIVQDAKLIMIKGAGLKRSAAKSTVSACS
jgi:hypothetical protein